MPRRFVTCTDIDAIADAGRSELLVDELTTVTDIAREPARERGVRLVEELAPAPLPVTSPATVESDEDLPAAVRDRVLADHA